MRSLARTLVALLLVLSLVPMGASDTGSEGGATAACPEGTHPDVGENGEAVCVMNGPPTCPDGTPATQGATGAWECAPTCPDGSEPDVRADGSYTCGTEQPQHEAPTCVDGTPATPTADGSWDCAPTCPDGTPAGHNADGSYQCGSMHAAEFECPEGLTPARDADGSPRCDGAPPCPDGSTAVDQGDGTYTCPDVVGCPPGQTMELDPNGFVLCYSAARPADCHEGTEAIEIVGRGWLCLGLPECGEGLVRQAATDGWPVCMHPCVAGAPMAFGGGTFYVCPEDVETLDFSVCGEAILHGCLPPPRQLPYCGDGLPADIPCVPAPAVVDGEYITPAEACKIALAEGFEGAEEACAQDWFAPLPEAADETAMTAWRQHLETLAPDDLVGMLAEVQQTWSTLEDEKLEKLAALASAQELFGLAAFDGETLQGTFVELAVDDTGLGFAEFTLDGISFFDSIEVVAQGEDADLKADFSTTSGAALYAGSGDILVETHDNDDGATVYRTLGEPFDLVFDLAEDAIVAEEQGVLFVELDGERVAVIGGEHELDGTTLTLTVTTEDPVTILGAPSLSEGGSHPDPEEALELDLIAGIAEGAVGAELTLVGNDEGAIHDVVSYDGITVGVRELDDGAMTFAVAREDPEGSAVVFTFARSALDVEGNDIRVLVDDRELSFFETLGPVLVARGEEDTDADSPVQGFFASADESTVRVVVRFSHFSEHTVRIERAERPDPPEVTPVPTSATPPATAPPTGADAEAPKDAGTPGAPVALVLAVVALAAVAARGRRE